MPAALSRNLEKALAFARQEAIGMESKALQSEHLLLGLSRVAGDPAAEYLRQNGLTLPFVTLAVDHVSQRMPEPHSLTYDDCMQRMQSQCELQSDRECGTADLLFVLLDQPRDSFVGMVFSYLGFLYSSADAVRFIDSYEVADEKVERLKSQISTWQSRAEMAHSMGFEDLAKQALEYKRKYERLLKITLEKKSEEK